MKICSKCFNDTDIANRILSLKKEDICDIHLADELIFDTETDDQLAIKTDITRLLDLYRPVDINEHLNSSESEPKMIIDRLQSDWNLFNADLSDKQIRLILQALLCDYKLLASNLFDRPLILNDFGNEKFIQQNKILKTDSWQAFKEHLFYENRFFNDDIDTEKLSSITDRSKISLNKDHSFYRARIVNDFNNISESSILMPPKEKALNSEGRLDPKGMRLLYLANQRDVAIKEIRPLINDKVIIAPIHFKETVSVLDLTAILNLSPFSMLDTTIPSIYQVNKSFLKKLILEMEKPVSSQRSPLDYLPTQYFSCLFKTKYEGIKYRSTVDSINFDIALFDDKKVQINVSDIEKYTIKEINYKQQQLDDL